MLLQRWPQPLGKPQQRSRTTKSTITTRTTAKDVQLPHSLHLIMAQLDPIVHTFRITSTGGNIGRFGWRNTEEHLLGNEWWRIWGNCWWAEAWPYNAHIIRHGFILLRDCALSLPGEFVRFHVLFPTDATAEEFQSAFRKLWGSK